MKTKLVKNIMAPLVAACALVLMVAPTATGQGTEGGRLQGTWEMQVTLTDCAGHVIRSFSTLQEFIAGGTTVESSAGNFAAETSLFSLRFPFQALDSVERVRQLACNS